jgi:glucose-1-phosphate thymidylyltransferase
VLWVKEIPNPEQFGVVKLDAGGNIIGFVEKPKTPVSNLAMIGIYYFKEAGDLKTEIQYLIDNDIRKGGEFQLPDALTRMLEKGRVIVPGKVNEWMDCGNYAATAETNSLLLSHLHSEGRLANNQFTAENSHITEPCFIGEGAVLRNAKVGPGVSLGPGTIVENADIRDSIIGERSTIRNARIENSMIGSHCEIDSPHTLRLSLGDYSVIS